MHNAACFPRLKPPLSLQKPKRAASFFHRSLWRTGTSSPERMVQRLSSLKHRRFALANYDLRQSEWHREFPLCSLASLWRTCSIRHGEWYRELVFCWRVRSGEIIPFARANGTETTSFELQFALANCDIRQSERRSNCLSNSCSSLLPFFLFSFFHPQKHLHQ